MNMKKKISIVIPFYNESSNIDRIYEELDVVRRQHLGDFEFEILLMDNHSTDDSFERAARLASKDPAVRVVRLSRNFGYQANILTGFLQCSGDAAIQLDADGEDDPALIPQMIQRWGEGLKVVYGIRRRRAESWWLSLQRRVFYRLLDAASSLQIPPDAGDFRLLDRQVIECLRNLPEANPYIRGLVAYAGFPQTGFIYDRRPRYHGVSKFSWFQYLSLAWDGVTSFSREPLNLATWAGAILAVISFISAIFYLCLHLMVGSKAPGFTTLMLTMLFLSGVQLLCLGVVGTYIGRIFEDVKRRPISIIEKTYQVTPVQVPLAAPEHEDMKEI